MSAEQMHTPTLWCVNIHGPDDVIAQPDYLSAVRAANVFNKWWAAYRAESPLHEQFDARMWAVPIEWPHDAASHANSLENPSAEHGDLLSPQEAALEPVGWRCVSRKTGVVQFSEKPLVDLPFNHKNWTWEPLYVAAPTASSQERIAQLEARVAEAEKLIAATQAEPDDPALAYQRAEERLCACGAAGSGEGHTDWCEWERSEWPGWGAAFNRAALGAQPLAPEPEGWKPIETAPRDETPIRVKYDDGSEEDGVYWSEQRYCMLGAPQGACGPGWVSNEAGGLPVGDDPAICLWQPLPAAPERIVGAAK